MLIGIHGKIGAGKDTLAKMIQLAIVERRMNPFVHGESFEEYWNSKTYDTNFPYTSGWEIRKFADALKDIVCILIGCTREQLEDPIFKNSNLPEIWDVESGNLTLGTMPHRTRDTMRSITVREFLQVLGTDVMRKNFYDQVWVNALFSKYTEESKWIITDLRFPNEVKAINDRDGIIIKITRRPILFQTTMSPPKEHISETALDSYFGWDHEIHNNGTLEQLYDIAKQIVKEHNLT